MNTNILDFGAISDGIALNTKAIQNAINKCAESGGGRVTVPAGVYKTGTIWLKSHVELHLEAGAEFLASDNLDDYNSTDAYEQNYDCLQEGGVGKHLIIAHEIEDIIGIPALDAPQISAKTGLNIEEVLALEPQLVIMNGMDPPVEQVEQLEGNGVYVISTYAANIEETYECIRLIGAAIGKTAEAEALVSDMQTTFAEIAAKSAKSGKTIYTGN